MQPRMLMLTLFCSVIGLSVPDRLQAQDAARYNARGLAWHDKEEYDKAIAHFSQALQLEPNAIAYGNRGFTWFKKGDSDKAIADYTEALRLDPKFVNAYRDRAYLWITTAEYDRAISDCNQAIALEPNNPVPYNHRGLAWNKKGENDKALADYARALQLDPRNAQAYRDRALAWMGMGEYDKAIADCDQALEFDPGDAVTQQNRGLAWSKKGEFGKAATDFTRALRLAPKMATAYRHLAWLRATCPDPDIRDGEIAFGNASKAYQLEGGKDWRFFDTLAAAYAECGDFDSAKQWAQKAIDKATWEKDKKEVRFRLQLYEAGKPYRQEQPEKEGDGPSRVPK